MTITVWDEIRSERDHQYALGYTPEHDDGHTDRTIARAAAAYALAGQARSQDGTMIYPWDIETFKPKDARDSLIKAAALCIAEIERLDRAARGVNK